MGNGNAGADSARAARSGLLTPHGERERRGTSRSAPQLCSPNPSWGTGTADPEHAAREPGGLLTPHGERERASQGLIEYATELS